MTENNLKHFMTKNNLKHFICDKCDAYCMAQENGPYIIPVGWLIEKYKVLCPICLKNDGTSWFSLKELHN